MVKDSSATTLKPAPPPARTEPADPSSFKSAVKKLPLLRDLHEYFWLFPRAGKGKAHRGVFDTFEAAAAACPKGRPAGYNQEFIADQPDPARFTAGAELDAFDPRDYPVLVWLGRALEEGDQVFDLGGNVGHGYYAYRRFLRYPETLKWLICEIPEVCRAGRRLAAAREAKGLEFTEDFAGAEGADILLTCGTLQFMKPTLGEMLSTLARKPAHVLVQRVPLGDHPTYFTVENIGYAYCPYRIQNRRELIDSLTSLGYRLVDTWKDTKECRVPFHPARTVRGYQGAYFQLQGH